jgi:hypothetical protein
MARSTANHAPPLKSISSPSRATDIIASGRRGPDGCKGAVTGIAGSRQSLLVIPSSFIDLDAGMRDDACPPQAAYRLEAEIAATQQIGGSADMPAVVLIRPD